MRAVLSHLNHSARLTHPSSEVSWSLSSSENMPERVVPNGLASLSAMDSDAAACSSSLAFLNAGSSVSPARAASLFIELQFHERLPCLTLPAK
jgi:hypothetical protein